jgi:sarcosine oxidase
MEKIQAPNVVIGAGAVGAAVAYQLAKRGEPVVLLEQFALGHDRGSSHGASRIARHSYADAACARLMPAAFDAWRTLEADAAQPLFLRTGGISVCPAAVDYVRLVTENLAVLGITHRRMSGRALKEALPVFAVADDADVVFEPDAGMLAAARILRAEIQLARDFGGERTRIFEHCPVRAVDLQSDRPTIVTDDFLFVADRLIVAAGPWMSRLIPDFPVPLATTRQQVLYVQPPDACAYAPGRFPAFIFMDADEREAFYGMPAIDGLGVKVARHWGNATDPDQPERHVDDEYRTLVRNFLRSFLPALADAPIDSTETCIYTMAPDEFFRVGRLREDRADVLVASACSGHGFKFSCLVGRILADLATRGETDLPVDTWR